MRKNRFGRVISLKDDFKDALVEYLPECKQNEDFVDANAEFAELLQLLIDTVEDHLPNLSEIIK